MALPSPSRTRRFAFTKLGVVIAAALVAPLVAATPAAAATAANSDPTPDSASAGQLVPLAPGEGGEAPLYSTDQFSDGRYIVILKDAPAALYSGGVSDLRATPDEWDGDTVGGAETQAYVEYLSEQQAAVAESVGVSPQQQFSVTTNGFVSDLSADQAAHLASDPRVERVVENTIIPLASAGTSTGFLGLEGPDGVWAKLGGTAELGRGVVVGVIDTGIAPENPSFAGDPLGRSAGADPYREGDDIVFVKSDGGTFRGTCEEGDQFSSDDCSTKLVGARYFVDGFGRDRIGSPRVGEYLSPRDGDGHGSHTASTAAGNSDVPARDKVISGVTPRAKIAAYKACWSGPVAEISEDDGCASADLLAAIEAATTDGVDVINYSIGGDAAKTTNSAVDQAFMAAASAGVFVAAAGGNSGPDSSTLDNASPWITTVAASTIPAPAGTVVLGDGQKFLGSTLSVPVGGVSGSLVLGSQSAAAGREGYARICAPDSLAPDQVRGRIVMCERGGVDRTAKSNEVGRAGGIGMVLINPAPSSLDVDDHAVPTVHLDPAALQAVTDYAATPNPRVTLLPGRDPSLPEFPTPQIAGFSSRGPVLADGSDIIKPDIAAPGTTILAALGNPESGTPTYGYLSGTSMASPHIAGFAAMYLSVHPNASPAEIKSAMMTTATDTVDGNGQPAPDPFAQGNGQVSPATFLEPGLVYLNDAVDWQSYLKSIGQGRTDAADIDASDLNLASIGVGGLAGTQTVTRTVTSTAPGSYDVSVSGLAGVDAVVTPSTLTFDAAGEQREFTVTFTQVDAPLYEFTSGYLTWTEIESGAQVRSAIAVQPIQFDADARVRGEGSTGRVDITTRFGETAQYDVATVGLTRGSRVNGEGTVGAQPQRFAVTVPDTADLLRIDLDALDESANLDLRVWRRTSDGRTVPVAQSVTPGATESVDVDTPEPGTYVAEVLFTGGGSGSPLGYTLSSYVLDADQPGAAFTVDPQRIAGETGSQGTVTASWSDLPSGTYLGILGYGETGVSTVLTIDAGTMPAGPGEAKMTVSPSATEWLLSDRDLRVTVEGLMAGAVYEATIDGEGPVRTGTANEDGMIDWLVSSVGHSTPGPHTIRVRGEGLDEERSFRTSPITFAGGYVYERPTFSGDAAVMLETYVAGTGLVRYEVRDHTGTIVASHDVKVVAGEFAARSPEIILTSGTFDVTATAIHTDGSPAAAYEFPPLIQDRHEPGVIDVSEPDADGVVTVDVTNNTGLSEPGRITYNACDGSRIVASEILAEGVSTDRWRIANTSSVVLTDRLGQELWRSDDAGRCGPDRAAFGDPLGQDLWMTATAASPTGEDYDPQRPIALELGYRYEPYTELVTVTAGEGNPLESSPFLVRDVRVTPVEIRGPIIREVFTGAEDIDTWGRVTFYAQRNGLELLITDTVTLPSLKATELVPGRTIVTPGTASISGEVRVDQTVSAQTTGWSPADVVLTYQWLIDGADVDGATTAHYTPVAADTARQLAVRVTGKAADGASASVVSSSVTVAGAREDTPTPSTPPARGDGGLANTGAQFALLPALVLLALVLSAAGVWLVRRSRHTS